MSSDTAAVVERVPRHLTRRNDHLFYCTMAAIIALVVFIGFSRSFF